MFLLGCVFLLGPACSYGTFMFLWFLVAENMADPSFDFAALLLDARNFDEAVVEHFFVPDSDGEVELSSE